MEREPIKYEDISRLYYRLFRTMGILPSSSSRRTTLLRVYFHVTIVLYYSMSMFDGLRMLGHNDIEIEYVFEEVVIHGICARFLILSCRREELAELLLSCEKLWRMLKPGEDRVVKSYEKIARYLAHYITWTTLVAIFFYIVAARIVKLPPAEVNGTERRMLPFRFYVDVQRQPWYDIVTVLEIVVVLNIAMIVSTIETTGPFLITMACGYLRSIRNRLLAIADEAEGRGEISRLSTIRVVSCVKFHQKIMRFCQDIEKLTSSVLLVQVVCTAYNISLVGFRILKNDPNAVKFVPLLLLNLLQLFTAQWIPEHLLSESKAIANAAYSASLLHPEYEPRANRALLFVMLRANRPVQITAGGYMKLSLETFKRMLTSALSFFTVLRSINDGAGDEGE
ncbi:odorant receptor 230 [Nasonia vitripennis]|uniref:Odorant receptor n=1 Tax=Nasonia vitripennis TaxID=7425 RepID=A0A7M6UVW9_NASVI|nr:odorant receptor 230 [Nasonia vitripennis]